MQVGDRVMVKATGERRHIIDTKGEYYRVVLDGDDVGDLYSRSELLPIEVVVLEGPVVHGADGDVYVNNVCLTKVTDHGEMVRITVERVKKG